VCVSVCVCVCVVVSEVVSPDSAATVAPPVVMTPISSTSAREGEPARFQCRVRGDGERSGLSPVVIDQPIGSRPERRRPNTERMEIESLATQCTKQPR